MTPGNHVLAATVPGPADAWDVLLGDPPDVSALGPLGDVLHAGWPLLRELRDHRHLRPGTVCVVFDHGDGEGYSGLAERHKALEMLREQHPEATAAIDVLAQAPPENTLTILVVSAAGAAALEWLPGAEPPLPDAAPLAEPMPEGEARHLLAQGWPVLRQELPAALAEMVGVISLQPGKLTFKAGWLPRETVRALAEDSEIVLRTLNEPAPPGYARVLLMLGPNGPIASMRIPLASVHRGERKAARA